MNDIEIINKLSSLKLYGNYVAITFDELVNLNKSELDNILSVCWHEGKFRCKSVGIENVFIEGNYLHWDDSNGNPKLRIKDFNTKIDNIGNGEWNYGLYKKVSL